MFPFHRPMLPHWIVVKNQDDWMKFVYVQCVCLYMELASVDVNYFVNPAHYDSY